MNIKIIENKLTEINDLNYRAIIQFIIEAVRDYPIYNLNDTNDYFGVLKKLFGTNNINIDVIASGLKKIAKHESEDNIWVATSLSTLMEAFILMKMHSIKFETILEAIETLNNSE